jgi:arylsulfatase
VNVQPPIRLLARHTLLAATVHAGCTLAAAGAPVAAPQEKPNIILILADDMGYSDLACYGGEIETPNLDALAAKGLRFASFYNASRCCPSRASLLTGIYSHQAGVGSMIDDRGLPAYRGKLNRNCVTIAEALKACGYATFMVGKWHVGGEDFSVPPWERGFDHSLSAKAGGFYYGGKKGKKGPGPLWLDGRNLPADSPELPEGWYSTDLFTDYSIRYIDQALDEKKPFFLYLAHTAPHFPLQAPESVVAKYRGRFMDGWDKLREERYRRQVASGLIPASWPLSPISENGPKDEKVPAWDSLDLAAQERSDRIMALYAACVDRMDQSVGRIVEELKKRNALDNTLIIFLSDNGGSGEGPVLGKLDVGPRGESAFCGLAWARLENTPFRYHKHYSHEGGTATPLIAHWPAGIRSAGEIIREKGHIIDIMPTLLDVAGATYPAEFAGEKITPMEGKSLLPVIMGKSKASADTLFWEHNNNAAVREGNWKLVRVSKGAWELYDMASDGTERANLATAKPQIATGLENKWIEWANRVGVFPKPAGKQAQPGGNGGGEN